MKKQLTYIWRALTMIVLFLGAVGLGAEGDGWVLILWFVFAWGSYWLAKKTGENEVWAPLYGLTWGILSIAYYSVIYFKNLNKN